MDIYPYLGIAAMNTEKVEMGPFVTNPLTRHPSVTASAMATIDMLSGGRAFLGLGRGGSAVKMLGWRPAKWKEYEQSIHDMRSWMRDDRVRRSRCSRVVRQGRSGGRKGSRTRPGAIRGQHWRVRVG